MKKLNNKGFAISTMLYGILTMIILILMLLLNIMRSSYTKENNAISDISYYLNKCVSKQVALESCYKKYNDDADNLLSCREEYETYTSCVGSDVSLGGTSGNVSLLNRLVLDNADSSETGLIIDSTRSSGTSIRYIYIGSSPKNYIKFGNKSGRIIAIENDGTIKVMLSENINASFDKESSAADTGVLKWTRSTLHNTINSKFVSMEYTSKVTSGKFYTGALYNTYSAKEAIDTIRVESADKNFGIVSVEDYLKASGKLIESTNKCDLTSTASGSIATALSNCSINNWMNGGSSTCHWTLNGFNGSVNMASFSSSGVVAKSPTSTCTANMVIYLKSTVTANVGADGSSSNPYIID